MHLNNRWRHVKKMLRTPELLPESLNSVEQNIVIVAAFPLSASPATTSNCRKKIHIPSRQVERRVQTQNDSFDALADVIRGESSIIPSISAHPGRICFVIRRYQELECSAARFLLWQMRNELWESPPVGS